MILKTLKNSYPVQISLFVILPFLLWIPSFISPPEVFYPDISGPVYRVLYRLFYANKLLAVITAFTLMLLQGLFLNYILSVNSLISKITFLPAVLFTAGFSFAPQLHTISPVLLIHLFLLLILRSLFKAYNSSKVYDAFFYTCSYISIITLTYPPAVILIFIIPIAVIIYKLFFWRIWVISLLGILAPYIFVFFYYWYLDELNAQWMFLHDQFSLFPNILTTKKIASIFLSISTAILFVVSARVTLRVSADSVVNFRRKTLILFYSSILMLFISFYEVILPVNITFIAYFLAFGFTQSLYKKWKIIYHGLLFLLFISTIVINCIS